MVDLLNIARKVLTDNFKAKEGEKVLIFTDKKREELLEIAFAFYKAGCNLGLRCDLVIIEPAGEHGREPEERLWVWTFGLDFVKELGNEFYKVLNKENLDIEEIKSKAKKYINNIPDIVIALSFYSTSHTVYRKLQTDLKTRYASMPIFEKRLVESLDVSPDELKPLTLKLSEILTKANRIRITNRMGTDLKIDLEGRQGIADTGDLSFKGAFSNLPAGEAFIAPVEGKANGKMVIEWDALGKLEKPTLLEIKSGRLIKIEGDEKLKNRLLSVFNKDPNANLVAEVGLGTNPKAKHADNVLEAEKILGTVHIAFGDNSTFGGKNKASFHQDFVIFKPTVEVKIKEQWQTVIQEGHPIT